MIFTKGAHEGGKFQTFRCSGEISPNLYFDRLLLLNVYKISAAKVHRSYVSWYWRVAQNLKKNRSFVWKMPRIWWLLIQALKSLKNLHFNWYLLSKVYNDWPKAVLRSCISWRWTVMQSLKNGLWFGKWHEEFGKLGTFTGSLRPKLKMHERKIYRGVMCNDTEEW